MQLVFLEGSGWILEWITREVTKTVMRYCQATKDFMPVYSNYDELELAGYARSDFVGSPDHMKSTPNVCCLVEPISRKSVK